MLYADALRTAGLPVVSAFADPAVLDMLAAVLAELHGEDPMALNR